MKQKSQKKIRLKASVLNPLLFVIALLLMIAVFPRGTKFKYLFNEGKPWKYNLLTAPFDFPIYKSDVQLKTEQDSILQYYEPYFTISANISKEQLAEFEADVSAGDKFQNLKPQQINYIRTELIHIYRKGIMNVDDFDDMAKSKKQSLRLLENNMAISRKANSFYTIRTAYQKIFKNKPASIDEGTLQRLSINNYLKENIKYDVSTSNKAKKEFIQQVSPAIGMVQTGERIIDEGEIVDYRTYHILSSLKKATEERTGGTTRNRWIILGELLLVGILMSSFYLYLLYFRPMEYKNRKHVIFMLSLITFFVLLTGVAVNSKFFNVYVIPFAIATILIRTFIDSRTALFSSLIMILISTLMVPFPFEFVVIELTVTMICIFTLKELSERSQLIRSSFFILTTYLITYIGIVLYQEGTIEKVGWVILLSFLINFIFIMFSYLLVYMVEKTFGFISGVSMIELSNINKPLLLELSEKAPGTFQHSMQVSNLATAGALKIGANATLIRTGALYHDVGKIKNPAFFTENQTPGMNPHVGLPFEESARIIINHVKDGVEIATKNGLPKQIIDFIKTHHGTSMPRYFYNSWKNANPDKEIDESVFRYPGPNPFTKETAIMMMADTVEAASRSLSEYSDKSIRDLVNKLINSQLNEGLFRNAPITFREVEILKAVFIDKLKTIYHSRIEYPELKENE